VKLNSTGAKLVFSTFLGGTSSDRARDVEVDSSGNTFITGYTSSSDFPTTSGAFDTSHNSYRDVFLTKLNSTGAKLIYSTYVGGGRDDEGNDVEIDSSGNAYVTGETYYYYSGGNTSTGNFPTTYGAYDRTHNGRDDIFAFKMDRNGTSLIYSTFIGGNDYDVGEGISIDSNGTAYIGGYSESWDFPTTWGAQDTSQNGNNDAVFVKLNRNGAGLDYSTFIGGSSSDLAYDAEYPGNDKVIISGATRSSNFPTINTSYDTSINSGYDVFITKMDFIRVAPPTEPRDLRGTLKSDHVLLTWNHPADNGTAALLGYKIYRYDLGGNGSGNRSTWFTLIASIGPTTIWRDYNITLGHDYFYWLIAHNKIGDSPESNWINVSDHISPYFIRDWTPSTTYSGEQLKFTLSAGDNVKVKTVEAFYWYPGKLVRSGMMSSVDRWNWSLSIDIHLDVTSKLLYYFKAEDYYKNRIDSDQSEVDIIDGRPYFIADLSPDTSTTGEEFEFSVEVKDDSSVAEVCADYWYGSGATNNVTMTKSGDVWSLKITIEDTFHPLGYRYHAVDASGHWNQTGIEQIPVIDNDLPSLVLDDAPGEAATGRSFMFMVEAEDNIEVASVSVEYWFGEATSDNVTMDKWTGEVWRLTVNIPDDDLAPLHYRYWISDSSGNTVNGPETTVEVKDNIPPTILSDKTSEKAYTGSTFKFNVQVTDNIIVEEVWIEYWFEGGVRTNLSAGEGADLHWELEIDIPHILDDLKFIYHIKDSSGNWYVSIEGLSDLEDDVRPVFIADSTPTSITTGEDLFFEIQAVDNIRTGLVTLEYWFGYGDHSNVSMGGTIDYTFTLPVPADETEDIHYFFSAIDTSQNWNRTETKTVDVLDDDIPEITGDTTPSSGKGGEKLTFTVYAQDNIGMSEATVEYWFDDGEHTNSSMMGGDPFRFILVLPDEGGRLHYRFHISDLTGNEISSEEKEIVVANKDGTIPPDDDDDDDITPPDDDDDDVVTPVEDDNIPSWGWFLIVIVILLFILTVVNILVTMMRRKSTPPDENGNLQGQQMEQPVPEQQYDQYPQYEQQMDPQEVQQAEYYSEQPPQDPIGYDQAPQEEVYAPVEGDTTAYEQEVQPPIVEQEINTGEISIPEEPEATVSEPSIPES